MSQDELNNLFGGMEKMAKQWQDAVVDSWSGMTKQAVGSDSFSAASSAYLDWTLNAQKQVRSNSAQFMDALEFPKRSDIARLSKQISTAETRVADCEDVLDKLLLVMRRLEAKVDDLIVLKQQAKKPAAPPAQEPLAAAPPPAAAAPARVAEPAPVKPDSAPKPAAKVTPGKPASKAKAAPAKAPAKVEESPKAKKSGAARGAGRAKKAK